VQFSVITADDAEPPTTGRYWVEANGVLVVDPIDDSQPIIRLSLAFWRQVIEPRSGNEVWGFRE
jgi:hypothetical protein